MKGFSLTMIFFVGLFFLATLVGCSSEDRDEFTEKQAEKITDSIKKPIDQAKDAARQLDKHNTQFPEQ